MSFEKEIPANLLTIGTILPTKRGKTVVACRSCGAVQFLGGRDRCLIEACRKFFVLVESPFPNEECSALHHKVYKFPYSMSLKVQEVRHSFRLFQREASRLMGNKLRTYMSKIENGRVIPTIRTLRNIAKTYFISPADLLVGEGLFHLSNYETEIIKALRLHRPGRRAELQKIILENLPKYSKQIQSSTETF